MSIYNLPESTDIRLRDEFLERVEFETVRDAQAKGKWFRRYYNAVRQHSSLDYATPKDFSTSCDRGRTCQHINLRISLLMCDRSRNSHFRWTNKWGAAHPTGEIPSKPVGSQRGDDRDNQTRYHRDDNVHTWHQRGERDNTADNRRSPKEDGKKNGRTPTWPGADRDFLAVEITSRVGKERDVLEVRWPGFFRSP